MNPADPAKPSSVRVLLVSTFFPSDPATFVHGVHKRLGMFVEAIKDIAQLDMLFYVPPSVEVSQTTISAYQDRLCEHWNAQIQLFLCPRFERTEELSPWRSRLQRYGAGALSFFQQGVNLSATGPQQVRAFESCLQRRPDMIFAHRLPAICPALLTQEELPPILFDLDDIEHIVFLRQIASQKRLITKILSCLCLPALWWGERRAIRLASQTFVCSESDRLYLKNIWRLPRVATVPNAVPIPAAQPVAAEPTLLFLGTYLYDPNVEGAQFLLKRIFPQVIQAMPNARLILAGVSPERIHGYSDRIPGVEFTGFVDDLDKLYRRARVICAPLFSGVSGTQTKLIEAAAYGKPIIANRLGAAGVAMRDGHELLVRNDPKSFAEACLQLLKDTSRCRELGSAARAKAMQLYNRTNIIRTIQRYLKGECENMGIAHESYIGRSFTDRSR